MSGTMAGKIYDASKIHIYVPLIDFWFEGYSKDIMCKIQYDHELMDMVATQKGNQYGNRRTSNTGTITLSINNNSEVLDEIMVLVDAYRLITVGFPLVIANTNDGRDFDSYMFDGCIITNYPEASFGGTVSVSEVKIRFGRQFPMVLTAGMEEIMEVF